MAPILYDRPSELPLATNAVMTSPAPLARASNVTAAIASDSSNHSDKNEIAGAKYSSTTPEMNLKMKRIIMKEMMDVH